MDSELTRRVLVMSVAAWAGLAAASGCDDHGDGDADSDAVTDSDPDADAESDADADAHRGADADADSDADADGGGDADCDADRDADGGWDADSDPDGEADGDGDGDGGADADADVDADADSDAVGDADSDTEDAGSVSDADLDSHVDADIEGDADADADEDDADVDVDPERWYEDIEHLSDEDLIDALFVLVDGHVSLGYTEARRVMFTEIDEHGGLIECVYTGLTVAADGTYTPGSFNTEHTWPQSEGADSEPARSDLHHLFPTDSDANSRRGSYPFGETACTGAACTWNGGGSELGAVEGGTTIVFQVRPETRGDIARAHFYFSVRYGLAIPDSEEAFLRAWNDEDPPSPEETDRNDAIEIYQFNRNPFVDRPDFVARIAGF